MAMGSLKGGWGVKVVLGFQTFRYEVLGEMSDIPAHVDGGTSDTVKLAQMGSKDPLRHDCRFVSFLFCFGGVSGTLPCKVQCKDYTQSYFIFLSL
jgi:hypothetical protein